MDTGEVHAKRLMDSNAILLTSENQPVKTFKSLDEFFAGGQYMLVPQKEEIEIRCQMQSMFNNPHLFQIKY